MLRRIVLLIAAALILPAGVGAIAPVPPAAALGGVSAEALLVADPVGPDPFATQSTVYRFWSPTNQTHFYTMNVHERDSIISHYPTNIWTYEGAAFQSFPEQQEGTVPLYRFWSPKLSGHFFTANAAEKDSISRNYPASTWSFEGVAFYVYPTDTATIETVPVARFWSPQNQHHFYTADANETQIVRGYPARIWSFDGINYRVPASVDLPIPATPAQYVTPAPPPPVVAQPGNPGDTKNCSDFRTFAEANAWFMTYYPLYGDVARLDQDNNGIPCETLR